MKNINKLNNKHNLLINYLLKTGKNFYKFKPNKHLSPIGWHVLHCLYIECLWIRELFLYDNCLSKKLKKSADGIKVPTRSRGNDLPNFDYLLDLFKKEFSENIKLINNIIDKKIKNKTAKIEYILNFLINHHSQHIETIRIILNLKNLAYSKNMYENLKLIEPRTYKFNSIFIKSDTYTLGASSKIFSYDNEKPKHKKPIKSFYISKNLITISEWLGFIDNNGYNRKDFWSKKGWAWKKKNNINKPLNWFLLDKKLSLSTPYGYITPKKNEPVTNISLYELEAFACSNGLKIPHEFEWEVSHKKLMDKNLAWEWSRNFFFPYRNFMPFPYREYSEPWFNNKYYTLKGSSIYTEKEIKRSTFRNFYEPYNRFIFSGGRLSSNT